MSLYTKVVREEFEELIFNLDQLYKESFDLHQKLLEEVRNMKAQKKSKRSWEYATYVYVKSVIYERKSLYNVLCKTACEIEKFIDTI